MYARVWYLYLSFQMPILRYLISYLHILLCLHVHYVPRFILITTSLGLTGPITDDSDPCQGAGLYHIAGTYKVQSTKVVEWMEPAL